eukprot:scaffold9944_cov52-Cyclotella_meneghiniana.AAC.4
MACPSSRTTILTLPPSRPALPPSLRGIATGPTHQPWLAESALKQRRILQTNKRRRRLRVRQNDNIVLSSTCQSRHAPLSNSLLCESTKVEQCFRNDRNGRLGRFWPSYAKKLYGRHSNGCSPLEWAPQCADSSSPLLPKCNNGAQPCRNALMSPHLHHQPVYLIQWPPDGRHIARCRLRVIIARDFSHLPSIADNRTPVDTNTACTSTMPSPNSASFSLLPRGSASSSPGLANPTIKPVVTAEKVTQSAVDNGTAAIKKATPGFLASSASKILKSGGGKGHKRFKNGMGHPSGGIKGASTPKSPIKKNLIIPNPNSPKVVGNSNKRVQVASPTRDTALNPDASIYSPSSPLSRNALSFAKVAATKQFSPMSDSTEDTMDRVVKNGVTAAAVDSDDETESIVIEKKPKRFVRESTGGIFSDSSTGTTTTAFAKEEVEVEDASDEDVTRPDPSVNSSPCVEQPCVENSTLDNDHSGEWEDVAEEDSNAGTKAAKKKPSPKKSQANIKSMFQKQQQQKKDQQRVQSNDATVSDYKFNMEDPITSAMDEALALVATLLYDAYAETSSFAVHPSQGPFTVGFHSEENEMWAYSGEGIPLIKLPDEMWMGHFQDDNEECELNKIDESPPMFKADASPPASDSSERPAGANSRQRRKERRAAERVAATTDTPPTAQSSGTGEEPVSVFQQEMDRLAAARDEFCNNPPQFEDLMLQDEGVHITVNTIEYTEATLAKATPEDLEQIRLMNWPAPNPEHSTIYRATISNSEGHVPLTSDSAHSHFDAIVSALYWIEYSKRGLSDPSLPQPSNTRPYHYKPIDFAFYDIDAPRQLGINTTEELIQYLSVTDDEETSDQDMEGDAQSKTKGPKEFSKPAGALKSSSYATPPVNENAPTTQLQRILASAAQPSAGPERNITGESCLLTAWVDPVPGLHPTQVLMERAKLIVTLGHKVDVDFELLPMFEEQAKQMKLKPITASGKNSALTKESIMHYCHVPTPWHLKAVKPGATYADGNPIKQPTIYTILRIKSSYSDTTILRYLLPELDVLGISVGLKGVQLPDTQTKSVMFGVHPDSCPAGLGTLLQYCYRFEIEAMVREGKISQIEGGSLELHDLYFKVQGIKALKLDNPKDLAELGIEGIANHWKRAMAVETPTNRTEVHNYFLESSLKSGMLRAALGDRATFAKIPTTRKGEKNNTKIRKFMRSARAHISVISHSDTRVFAGFLDLLYDVRTDWATGQQQTSSWRHKTSNILRLLYHITTKEEGIQLFHSVCPIQMGPDAGSVMVTFYRKPAILELVNKMAQSPVAWLYWWATEVLHISHKCMLLILKGCEMDDVYLIGETDWDSTTWTVTTPFEDAEDEFARRVEEDGLVFDMSALAPPTPLPVPQEPAPTSTPQSATANPNQQDPSATPAEVTGENLNSKGYYMSPEHQAAVDRMGLRDDESFATRATVAASRVSDATKNTSGAHTFRSQTTVDKKRSYRDQCIANAKRKAEEFADSLRSSNPSNLQGTPASNGPATTAPGKTSPANSHEAMMGSGASK